jgi:hypothetical protein
MKYLLFSFLLILKLAQPLAQGSTCVNATNVNPGNFTALAITGTGASQIDAVGANWYKFMPSTDGNLSINSCGGGSDTRLWIWSGSCSNLTLIGSNDDFNGCISSGSNSFASRVDNLILTAGSTYFFEWDNAWSSTGFTWNFTYSALPNNNDIGIIYLKNRLTKIPLNQANYGIPFGATVKNYSGNNVTNVTLTTEIYELPNVSTPIQVLTSTPITLGVGTQQVINSGTWFPNLSVSKNYFIKYIKTQTQVDGITTNDISTQNLSLDFNYYARDNNTYTSAFNWSSTSEYDQGVSYTITGNDVVSGVQFFTQSASTTQEYYIEIFPIINNIIQISPIYTSPNITSTGVGWQSHTLSNPISLSSGNYLFSVHKLGNAPYPIGCDASIFTTGTNFIRTNNSGNWNPIEAYSVNYAFMIRPKFGSNPSVDLSYISHQNPGGEFTKVHTRQSVNGNNLILSACGKNAGTNPLFNVTMTVNIKNVASNNIIYTATSSGQNLVPGQIDTFTVSNYTIQSLGDYSIEYIFNTVNDQIPFNNSYTTFFSRTKSELSRNLGVTGTIGIGNNATSAYDNGVIGQTFTIGQQDYLDSVKIGLAAGTPSNQPIRVDIYATNTSGIPIGSPIASTTTYTSTISNSISGANIVLPLSGGTLNLSPGTYFFGVIENAANIKLQTSTNYFKANRAFMRWNQNPNGATAFTPIENFGYAVALAINPLFKICLPIQVSSTVTNASCGLNNGAIQLSTSGGTGTFSFNWSNTSSNSALNSNLSPGNYTCQLSDANQCAAPQQNVSITMISAAVSSSVSSTINPLCNGGSNGAISMSASGGNGQFTYSWTPNIGNTPTISNLAAGSYTCQVSDGLGCSSVQQIVLTQPAPISVNSVLTPITCFGGNNGSLMLSTSGGNAPYQYNWTGNLGTTNSISNLSAGGYSCQITDINNCTLNQSFQIANPPAITNSILSISNVACFGNSTGTASILGSGGTGNLSYLWSPIASTSSSINNVPAGTYTCTISDANGCQQSTNVTIVQPSALSSSVTALTPVSCFGGTNGSAQVSGIGGTAPYLYAWSTSGGTNGLATNLSVGSYTCQVTDANGCLVNQVVQINGPTAISVGTSSISPATCGSNNGALSLVTSGGTGTYSYSWTPSVGSSSTLSNLFSGTYSVVVSDQNGCTGALSVGINSISGPSVSVISQTPSTCFNGSNGSAQISALGGTGTLTYSWSPGNPSGNGTNTIQNLSAGQYACQVIDANGCIGTIVVSIAQPLAVNGIISSITPVNCYGTSTGQINILATGGTPGYVYSWSPVNGNSNQLVNVPAGNYTCQITDQNGCQGNISATVSQPNPMQIVLDTIISPSCHDASNGSISLHAIGGNGNYIYGWTPTASTTSSIQNLSTGNYTVTATDILGCVTSQTFTIQSQSNIQMNFNTSQIDCAGNMNGQITLSPSNGITPYQFNWNNTATANVISNLSNGIYSCTITDALGCQKSFSDTIFTLSNLTLQANGTNIVCDSNAVGTVNVSATNGVLPYSYSWMNSPETTNVLQTVGPDTVQCIVSDGLNCQDTVGFQINITDLNVTNQITSVTCPGGQTGSINIQAQGGQAPYTYNWVDFSVNETIITGIGAGNYICSVQDQLGCSLSIQNVVYEPFPWTINAVIDTEVFGLDGGINLGVSGASPPYSYSWSSGQTTNDITQIAGGQYYVTITDSEGCIEIDTFQVDSQVSLTELSNEGENLYPNPNDGHFKLATENGTISDVIDTYGRSISFEVQKINSSIYEVRLSRSLPGIYYLRIVDENDRSNVIRFEVF